MRNTIISMLKVLLVFLLPGLLGRFIYEGLITGGLPVQIFELNQFLGDTLFWALIIVLLIIIFVHLWVGAGKTYLEHPLEPAGVRHAPKLKRFLYKDKVLIEAGKGLFIPIELTKEDLINAPSLQCKDVDNVIHLPESLDSDKKLNS